MRGQPEIDAPTGRGPGRPARISREQILAVARSLPPHALTMKAVADALQVDRKALHRHVGDRDGLLELVVTDLFESELRRVTLPDGLSWQELLRVYVTALRDGIARTGSVRTHYRLSGPGGPVSLALAERMLEALVNAGFGIDDAGSILTFVGEVAFSAARNVILAAETHVHPQLPEVAQALRSMPPSAVPLLSQVLEARSAHPPGQRDFDLDLRIVIAGIERLLL